MPVGRFDVTQDTGVPAAPSGCSAEPEPISVVSADTASIPNAECSLGVGDGSGQLFVHGSHEAIRRVRGMIFALEEIYRVSDGEICNIAQEALSGRY